MIYEKKKDPYNGEVKVGGLKLKDPTSYCVKFNFRIVVLK